MTTKYREHVFHDIDTGDRPCFCFWEADHGNHPAPDVYTDGYAQAIADVRSALDGCRLVGPAPIGPLFGAGWMKCLELANEHLDGLARAMRKGER